jgi:hypothetical protein
MGFEMGRVRPPVNVVLVEYLAAAVDYFTRSGLPHG